MLASRKFSRISRATSVASARPGPAAPAPRPTCRTTTQVVQFTSELLTHPTKTLLILSAEAAASPAQRPRSAPAVRRRIRTLSIQQSERAAHPATRKKAIQLLQALHRTVSTTDAQLRFGNPPQTRDRLVSRLGAPPNQLTPARLWHKIAKFGVVDRDELSRRVRELLFHW